MKHLRICTLILSFILTHAAWAQWNQVNQDISKDYPSFRYVGASYSTLFGTMAIWQGSHVLTLDKPKNHDVLAIATIGIGVGRLTDGIIHLFKPVKAEKLANQSMIQDEKTLKKLATRGRYARMARSSLIYANSALLLALYSKGDKDYKTFIYPGLIMGAVATFNLIRKSPEEKAYYRYRQDALTEFGIDLIPLKDGGILVTQLNF